MSLWRLRFFQAVLLTSLSSLVGCAVASDDVDGVVPRRKDTGAIEDGGADEDTSSEEDSSTPGTDSGSTGTDSGSIDTGSSSKDTGSGVDTGPAGTPCTTLGSSECASSFTELGSISGDTGSATKSASGSDSKWFHVTVSEDDSALFSSVDLRARITLSPSAGNFDLYVYRGKAIGDGGGVECSTVSNSSTNASGDDTIAMKWSDNRPIGGFDDTRVLAIEVRATDANCDGASWTLTVQGNK